MTKKELIEVGIFGYKDKEILGDLVKEIKTDMTEKELLEYCKKTFKGYTKFRLCWLNGDLPDFKNTLNI